MCFEREGRPSSAESIDQGRDRPQGGFSLIEVMVVLALMGLMAGLVTVNVRNYLVTGKQKAATAQIATFAQALETYYLQFNRYPTSEEGLDVLTQKTEAMPEPLLPRVPKDPWGKPYQYNQPGVEGPYEVICFGADGREGGSGADADIRSDPASK